MTLPAWPSNLGITTVGRIDFEEVLQAGLDRSPRRRARVVHPPTHQGQPPEVLVEREDLPSSVILSLDPAHSDWFQYDCVTIGVFRDVYILRIYDG